MEPNKMDMVRLPREEQIFQREDVLGRDASSVFPTEAKNKMAAVKSAALQTLGAKMFISESELEAIKAEGGTGAVEVGAVASDKPLAQLLQENKEKKDAEFQEKLKIIKQGTHKPLDADEAGFLEDMMKQEAAKERQWQVQQQEELQAYREALAAAQQESALEEPAAVATAAPAPSRPAAAHRKVEVRKALAPAVKIKPKARPAPPTPANTPEVKRPRLNDQPAAAAVVPAVLEAAANLVQKGQGQAEQEPESTESLAAQPADLTGLLGGYGSDSEEDS